MLTDAGGGPVSAVVAPANRHDSLVLQDMLEAVVVEPPPPEQVEQRLCLDAAFVGEGCDATARVFGYEPHVRPIGEERSAKKKQKKDNAKHKPRRWVVERTFAWLSRWRGILVRYEKKAANYLGAVQLACALLWFRRLHRLTT